MFNQNLTLVGLSSVDTAVPVAGPYFVSGKIQFPRISQGSTAVSGVIATISNRTGPVTILTTTAGSDGFYVDTLCTAGDLLRVALTSANAIDSADLNAVKCEISIGSGQ